MKETKIRISTAFLIFICGYAVYDPWDSFWPFLISVGLHEAFHILMLRRLGYPVSGLHCTAQGLEIKTSPTGYKDELWIASAGPVANCFLLVLSVGRYPLMGLINLVLICYNLLPFYPLDGGRILRCILRLSLPICSAENIEKGIGLCTYLILFLLGLYLTFVLRSGMWPMVFCAFLFYRIGNTILPERKTICGKT